MDKVLLLQELVDENSMEREYLKLCGYEFDEDTLEGTRYMSCLRKYKLIIISGERVPVCINLVQRIRECVQIPIIVLSERNQEWEKIKFFQSGVDDYLVKPYWQGELLARMKAHIERYDRLMKPMGIICVDDLVINAASRSVTLSGQNVAFRLKEFDVLLYLAQRKNQAISKREIYEAVWHDDLADEFYNTVAVHVKKIREKIEKDITNPKYIQTVWGIGYLFRA